MAEVPNGLDMLTAKVERRSRAVPPPRRPRAADVGRPDQGDPAQKSPELAEETAPERVEGEAEVPSDSGPRRATNAPPRPKASRVVKGAQAQSVGEKRPAVGAEEPLANLAVRVRRSLDNHLGDLLHSLKGEGIRSSKVEIIEMLLWELPGEATDELRGRLGAFRRAAPREQPL